MASNATSAFTVQQGGQPAPLPLGPRLVPVNSPEPEPVDNRLRPLEVAECTMCGVTQPLGLLVPDGSEACADIRWYCKDVKSCTERWTAARRQAPGAPHGGAWPVASGS
jgi:hypothetical protein